MSRPRKLLLMAGILLLLAVTGFFVVDIVRWNMGLDGKPDRSFTVVRAISEPASCKGYGCWYSYTTVYDKAGHSYRYDDHLVKVGARCTLKGHSTTLRHCDTSG
jgi:hypothetical protein